MTTEEVLSQSTVEGLTVKLPSIQLDRNEYLEVKKKLELIGGKWKGGKVQGFVFTHDPSELLKQVANGEKRNLKKEFQFFFTPDAVARMIMYKLPKIYPDTKIIEPSAGSGALITALRKYANGGEEAMVDCYEIMDINRTKLVNVPGAVLIGEDFLTCDKRHYYDIVIANPPFTKNQDIDHIRKMYDVCKPGGTIVTMSSVSWELGSNKKQVDFKNWLERLEAEQEDVAEGAFKEAGTNVRTKLLVIKKPEAAELAENIFLSQKNLEERTCRGLRMYTGRLPAMHKENRETLSLGGG